MSDDRAHKRWTWPLFRALSGATRADLGRDLLAGLSLAAIAIPQQMATARLGGFAPEVGLVAFVAAALGFAVFGANRQLAVGADSTITPIFAGGLASMAVVGSAQYAELAATLALMVAALLVLAGVLRLGWVADLLSKPVLTGFLAAIAVHIALSQAPSVLGLPEGEGDVYRRLAQLWSQAGAINPLSVTIGLGVLGISVASDRINPRIPGALIAVLGATLATQWFNLQRGGVAVLGQMRGGWPALRLPQPSLDSLLHLIGLAFVIALVTMVQTAATSRSFCGQGVEPRIGDDFRGVGAGNLLAGLIGAFPVDASPPATAIVAEVGGRSQYAGLTAAVIVLALAVFGTTLLRHAPVAALGGVLLYVAVRIFHPRAFADILRHAPAEFALALLTTALIVILPIQTGVAVSIFLSLAHGVFTITRTRPIRFERAPGTTVWWPASSAHPGETEPGVLVMAFQAPLSFLNAYDFRRGLLAAIGDDPGGVRLFVLEASSIVDIDFTAAGLMSEVILAARRQGADFAVARLESVRAQAAFDRLGVTETLGQDHIFRSVESAIRALAGPAKAGSR